MSTEKIIKNQAKKLLSGNWTVVISALTLLCAMYIVIIAVMSIFGTTLNVYDIADIDNLNASDSLLYSAASMICTVAMLAISPAINGLVKMVVGISVCGRTEISVVFYYFKDKKRYFRSIAVNFILYFLFSFISRVLDPYTYVTVLTGKSLQDGAKFDILTAVLLLTLIVSIIIKVLVYIVFVHYSLISYAMFDSIPISLCTFGMIGFALRHLGSTIRLAVSFLGWLLLCFFVVPAIYVAPYLMTSSAVSAKWLYALDKDRGLI